MSPDLILSSNFPPIDLTKFINLLGSFNSFLNTSSVDDMFSGSIFKSPDTSSAISFANNPILPPIISFICPCISSASGKLTPDKSKSPSLPLWSKNLCISPNVSSNLVFNSSSLIAENKSAALPNIFVSLSPRLLAVIKSNNCRYFHITVWVFSLISWCHNFLISMPGKNSVFSSLSSLNISSF